MGDCPYVRLESCHWECPQCGHVTRKPYETPPHRNCEKPLPPSERPPLPPNAGLTDSELGELFSDEDPTLWGNRIKAMTDAIGIPACGGCESRRQWINAAHEWVRRNRGATAQGSGS